MRITKKQLFRLSLLLIGVALVVGMFIFFNLNKASADNELAALDLIPKPEKLTELYFNDNANLPNAVMKQPISFAFVIHNLETTDFQYDYNVLVNVNGARHIVDSGSILVKDNQYFTKNEKFSLLNVRGTQEVIIELTNKRQSIDFWVRGSN
jgi:hypothetical protein